MQKTGKQTGAQKIKEKTNRHRKVSKVRIAKHRQKITFAPELLKTFGKDFKDQFKVFTLKIEEDAIIK